MARVRFEWKDKKPPFYWSILAVFLLLTSFLWLGFDFIVPYIGSRVPDSHHSSVVSIYVGTYYVQPWVVFFRNSGGWIPGSLFIALLLIEFVKGYYIPRTR
jgi:hypothetical protein